MLPLRFIYILRHSSERVSNLLPKKPGRTLQTTQKIVIDLANKIFTSTRDRIVTNILLKTYNNFVLPMYVFFIFFFFFNPLVIYCSYANICCGVVSS